MVAKGEVLKVNPVKDILDEVLETVEPIATFSIGDRILEFWKPDHISEAHYLRFMAVQVEQMVVSKQYTSLLDRLNLLSESPELDDRTKIETAKVAKEVTEKFQELTPLNCQYLEAVAELKQGELIEILKEALAKRNLRKQIRLDIFINELTKQVRDSMNPIEEGQIEQDEDEESDHPLEQEALPASENNGRLLAITSAA